MPLSKLQLLPNPSGYSVEDAASDVVSVQLDGGSSRFRRDRVDSQSLVRVTWVLNPSQYEYFRNFYRTTVKNGSDAFLVDLVLDTELLEEHTAHFVPGSVRLQEQKGHSYVVTAELEVVPTVFEDEKAELIFAVLYSELGEDYTSLFPALEDQLNLIVNIQLPAVL